MIRCAWRVSNHQVLCHGTFVAVDKFAAFSCPSRFHSLLCTAPIAEKNALQIRVCLVLTNWRREPIFSVPPPPRPLLRSLLRAYVLLCHFYVFSTVRCTCTILCSSLRFTISVTFFFIGRCLIKSFQRNSHARTCVTDCCFLAPLYMSNVVEWGR